MAPSGVAGPGSPVAVSALSANEACHAAGRHTANRPVGTCEKGGMPANHGNPQIHWFLIILPNCNLVKIWVVPLFGETAKPT